MKSELIVDLLDITTLTDSISLTCDNGQSQTFCGKRALVIWDNKKNQSHNLNGSTLFSLVGSSLKIKATDINYLGLNSFTLYVQLSDYQSLGYFPQSATFTIEILDPFFMYNVLLLRTTQLFNPTTNYHDLHGTSLPSKANDGYVTFYENIHSNYNWFNYLDVLEQSQQQLFNMGAKNTVYSILIVFRDQSNIVLKQDPSNGSQIFIGNDQSYPFSSSNSLCETITGNTSVRSQWISCSKGINGQYLWLVSSQINSITLSEIMAYQYFSIQINGTLRVTASSNQADVMLPLQQSNPVVPYNSISNASDPSGYNNYCYLSSIESQPTITIELKAQVNIFAIIFLPLIEAADPPNSKLFSNNIYVSVQANETSNWTSCSKITNSNQNPESNCSGILANKIEIKRNCSTSQCQLGVCQIGILSNCSCSNTTLLNSTLNENLFKSGENTFKVLTNNPTTFALKNSSIYNDSVSLVCGDGCGNTFCGNRTFAIWSDEQNSEVSNSTFISLSRDSKGQENLVINSTSLEDVGKYKYAIKVKLANYSEAGYFPFQTDFTLIIYCMPTNIDPITPISNFLYYLGSGPQLFNVSNYTVTPSKCFVDLTSIRAYIISSTPLAPQLLNIQISTLQFKLDTNNLNLDGMIATYNVKAFFGNIQNYQAQFSIQFQGSFIPIISNSTISLISEIQTPPIIPQLDQNNTDSWKYSFPQVIDDQNGKSISINLNCPATLSIFKRTIINNTLSLTLDISSQKYKDLDGGQYLCKFEISNGVKRLIYNVQFLVAQAKSYFVFNGTQTNNTQSKQELISPIPTILKVSNRGVVFVKWNIEMQNLPSYVMNVIFNETNQLNRLLDLSNTTGPLSVQIIPGSTYTNQSHLLVNGYSIILSQAKDLWVQLYFNDQEYISALSKDSLIMTFNQNFFYSTDKVPIQSNYLTVKKIVPRQISQNQLTVKLGKTAEGVLYSMAVTVVLGSPPFQYFANQILSIIEPLTVITHYILINLRYPANIQDFFSQIFPLIQFDIFQTAQLYQLIFNLSEINDGPIDDQFNEVGYNSILAINNIGSLLLFILIKPIILVFLLIMRRLLKNCNGTLGKYIQTFFNSKIDDFMWNGYISFYFSAYLVLSMIGWISINDLRFGSNFTATENFSSILGIILVSFSILFPILIFVIYKRGYKPYGTFNINILFRGNQAEGIKKFVDKYETIENYFQQTQTYEQRKQFMRKQGVLLKNLRTNQIGISINQIIGFPLMTIFSQVLVIFAVLGLIKIQALSILAVMYTAVIQICYLVTVKPYSEKLNYYKDLFNLITKLFLTYLLVVFTDYVDLRISNSGGNQFLYVVLVNIVVNLIFASIVPSKYILRFMKKKWKRFREAWNKYQEKEKQKQLKLSIQNEKISIQMQKVLQENHKLHSFMQIDELSRIEQQANQTTLVQLKSNKIQKLDLKTHQLRTNLHKKKISQDINLHQMQDSQQQKQSSKLLINRLESNYPQLLIGEQIIDHQTSDFLKQFQQAENNKIEKISGENELKKQEIKKSTKKIMRNQDSIAQQQKYKKEQLLNSIGMTDISKWQRHWDYAFEPTRNNINLNIKEAETYKNYLKTRKIIQEWDKPPKFDDLNLSQECEIAYKSRIEELKLEKVFPYEVDHQRIQLRELVAEKLQNQQEIEDDKSRFELIEETYQLLRNQYA